MHLANLLTPWFILAAVLIPLVYVEKWVHSHLYGVGWLLTNDKKSATALYYVLLFPGVFVHEFVQYLAAGALNVKIKRMIAWPKAQNNGTLRLDFVQIQNARWYQAAIIGAAPMIVGMAIVWMISSRVLGLEVFLQALETADITIIGPAFQDLASKPDFYLWLYLMFAVSNAMLPTPADREGWPLMFGLFAGFLVLLVLVGTGEVLLETFTGPVAHGVERLATALAAVLVVEFMGILFIGFFEEVLERATKRKFQYKIPQGPRRPGSARPLPAGAALPSIYNLNLPLPPPVKDLQTASRPFLASEPPPKPVSASAAAMRERPPVQPPTAFPPATPEAAPPARSFAADQTWTSSPTQKLYPSQTRPPGSTSTPPKPESSAVSPAEKEWQARFRRDDQHPALTTSPGETPPDAEPRPSPWKTGESQWSRQYPKSSVLPDDDDDEDSGDDVEYVDFDEI